LQSLVLTQTLKPNLFQFLYGPTKSRALIQNGVFQQPVKPLLPPVRNYKLVFRSFSAELILLVMTYDW
jgi:hypothetical protein